MASPGELVKAMAEVLGVPEASIVVHDRNLAIAGLRRKGGRGWSAAQVTPRDGANLLVAILGSPQVKDSVATTTRYGETRCRVSAPIPKEQVPEIAELPEDHSFIDALEALLIAAIDGSIDQFIRRVLKGGTGDRAAAAPRIELAALSPGTLGDIRISGISQGVLHLRYALPDPFEEGAPAPRHPALPVDADAPSNGDLEQYRRVSERTICHLADLFRSP